MGICLLMLSLLVRAQTKMLFFCDKIVQTTFASNLCTQKFTVPPISMSRCALFGEKKNPFHSLYAVLSLPSTEYVEVKRIKENLLLTYETTQSWGVGAWLWILSPIHAVNEALVRVLLFQWNVNFQMHFRCACVWKRPLCSLITWKRKAFSFPAENFLVCSALKVLKTMNCQ